MHTFFSGLHGQRRELVLVREPEPFFAGPLQLLPRARGLPLALCEPLRALQKKTTRKTHGPNIQTTLLNMFYQTDAVFPLILSLKKKTCI